MTKHLRNEIENLKRRFLSLSAAVEAGVHNAVKAIVERDVNLARKVIDDDSDIDRTEVEIEEECLKILALHQPVAIDLRFLISVLKINNDLERIGDLSSNIAEAAIFLSNNERIEMPFDLVMMSDKVKSMLKSSIDALVNLDAGLAHDVCFLDDEIDELHLEMYKIVENGILENPRHMERLLRFLSASRQLERIADHATNIAEDVIYMTEGEIFRHRVEDFQS